MRRDATVVASLISAALGLQTLVAVVNGCNLCSEELATIFITLSFAFAFIGLLFSRRRTAFYLVGGFDIFFSYFRLGRSAHLSDGIVFAISALIIILLGVYAVTRELANG